MDTNKLPVWIIVWISVGSFTYKTSSESCFGRCGQGFSTVFSCQCNLACTRYADCCVDYSYECTAVASGGGGGTDSGSFVDPLSVVMESLWNSDTNRLIGTDILINTEGNRLFTRVNEAMFSLPTFQAFIDLLDNYERHTGVEEVLTDEHIREIEAFLNVVLATETMALANTYLTSNGKVGTRRTAFRDVLKELWFNSYSRSSNQRFDDSSGFEHVMVGERKGSRVLGFHSWIQFYLQERTGSLTYTHMLSQAEPNMKCAAFTWYGGTKSKGSFFLGSSPEFDLAVYSVCALMHPSARCNFTIQGNHVSIQTWDIRHKAGSQIGTSYPVMEIHI